MTDEDMMEILQAAGIGVQIIDCTTPESRAQEARARSMAVPHEAEAMIDELCSMVTGDPARGTEHEGAFLDRKTKPRTKEIGKELYEMGGHELMLRAHYEVSKLEGFSYRSLELAFDGIGEWLG